MCIPARRCTEATYGSSRSLTVCVGAVELRRRCSEIGAPYSHALAELHTGMRYAAEWCFSTLGLWDSGGARCSLM